MGARQTPKPRRSVDARDYQHVPRPITALAKSFASGAHVAPHSHPRAQFLHAVDGVMRVTTADGAWVVPPSHAVWIPPGIEHEIRMAGNVAMRTLYIDPAAAPWLPDVCTVVAVTPLVRELILAAVEEPVAYPLGGRAEAVMQLLLHELQHLATVPLRIPLPRERRLAALCRALLDDPAASDTLEDWAVKVGASARTLARLFRREAGLSFGAWRQQVRLAEALSRLALGEPVATVARQLGYASPSAFTAMFRRALGIPPTQYIVRNPAPVR